MDCRNSFGVHFRISLLEHYLEKGFHLHPIFIKQTHICCSYSSPDQRRSGGKGGAKCVYFRLRVNKAILDTENDCLFDVCEGFQREM